MERPATDAATDTATDIASGAPAAGDPIGTDEWLIDAGDPLLTSEHLVAIADPTRPDRLVWNTFRTLALWNTEAWMPPVMEIAIGDDNPVGTLEWAEGQVVPWGAGPDGGQVCEVAVSGPDAYVVFACTIVPDPPEVELRAAAIAAVDGSLHPERQASLVVVAPPGSDEMPAHIARATDVELHEETRLSELLAGATGWISWPELGRLALDLAEEPDREPMEAVRRLVSQMQARWPDPNL